jgi:hypothetical protein
MTIGNNVAARRRFLETSGLGIVSLLGWPPRVSSSPGPVTAPQEAIVRQFLMSWSSGMQTVLSFLHEDCQCRLTPWGPERRGHRAISEAIAIDVERPRAVIARIFDCSTVGPLVVAHYQHRYVYEHGDLVWEGVATFYVRGGKIKEWRGYTIRVS